MSGSPQSEMLDAAVLCGRALYSSCVSDLTTLLAETYCEAAPLPDTVQPVHELTVAQYMCVSLSTVCVAVLPVLPEVPMAWLCYGVSCCHVTHEVTQVSSNCCLIELVPITSLM